MIRTLAVDDDAPLAEVHRVHVKRLAQASCSTSCVAPRCGRLIPGGGSDSQLLNETGSRRLAELTCRADVEQPFMATSRDLEVPRTRGRASPSMSRTKTSSTKHSSCW